MIKLEVREQPDGSYRSDPAPDDGAYLLSFINLAGEEVGGGMVALAMGDVWTGKPVPPQPQIFKSQSNS